MRSLRRTLVAALAGALLLTGTLAAGPAFADGSSPSGGDVISQCKTNVGANVPEVGPRGCRSVQSNLWGTGATCRTVAKQQSTSAAESCSPIDGRTISEHQVALYESGWVHKALGLQRDLDAAAPLWDEQLPHTHNTFNSSAYTVPTDGTAPSYYPTLTNQDPNQAYSIADQLRMDVRAIELDVHWVPSPFGNKDTGGFWVTLCHGTGESVSGTGQAVHIGCSYDRPFQDGIHELRTWLDKNSDQFVLLYLENQLFDNTQAHTIAAGIVEDGLGSKVYKPHTTGGGCATMPLATSAADILASGAQVLIVGNCGPAGSPWNGLVHERGPAWTEGGDPSTYNDNKCQSDVAAHGPSTFRRLYEDSTWLAVMLSGTDTAPFSPQNTADMVRCGVNIIGMDQLTPQDPRLAALVSPSGPLSFGVPVNGLQGARLRAVQPAGTEAWLDYRQVAGTWTPDAPTAHGRGNGAGHGNGVAPRGAGATSPATASPAAVAARLAGSQRRAPSRRTAAEALVALALFAIAGSSVLGHHHRRHSPAPQHRT